MRAAVAAAAAVVGAAILPAVDGAPTFATFTSDKGDVQGLISFTDEGDGSSGVRVSVDLCYVDSSTPATEGHKWHVHQFGVGSIALDDDADGHYDCASAGGHFDSTPALEVAGYSCDPAEPDGCYIGDMAGKLGFVNVGTPTVLSPTIDRSSTTAANLASHSIVIHGPNGVSDRIACAPLLPLPAGPQQVPVSPCAARTPSPPAGGDAGGRPPPPPPGDGSRPPPPAGGGANSTDPPPPPPPPPPRPAAATSTDPAKCSQPDANGDFNSRCDSDCGTCMGTQGIFKTPSSEAGAVDPYATDRTTMYGALSQCAATKVVAAATVADQQGCLTEMADAGMLQPLLKTLSCCVRDANMANQCAIGEDHKGCLGNKEKPFPIPAGDRATSPNTCRAMYEDTKLHTCGQAESILADPAALKDATSHGMRCIAQMQWTDGATDRSLQLGLPCDKMKDKLCFQGTKCTYPVMTCLLKSDVFSGMIDHCHADAYGTTEDAPAVKFPDEKVSCDIGSQFSGANVPYYCIGISFALILLSYLLIKVWFVVTVAKLLLYVYVVIEAICGFGVTIWSITLMVRQHPPHCTAPHSLIHS